MKDEIKKAKLGELIPDAQNANQGTARGDWALEQSIEKAGLGRSILIDKDGHIIAGNKTCGKAQELGFKDVLIIPTDGRTLIAVQRTDLSIDSPEGRELAIADNRTSELNLSWDPTELLALQDDDKIKLNDWWTQEEIDELLGASEQLPTEDPDDAQTVADAAASDDYVPRVQEGEIWKLGRHYIACADSTDEASIRLLMDAAGVKAIDMFFSDPPYGVSYAEKNVALNKSDGGDRVETDIENDNQSPEDCYANLWKPCFLAAHSVAKAGCSYYICAPQGGAQMMMMMMALRDSGWLVKHELIWVKNNHVLGRADYHYRHEPIIYGWKEGAGHYFIESRSEFSTWHFDKPHESKLHPTMKPVELVKYAISNSSKSGEVVLDTFLGSGTTLIASEEAGRHCLGLELSPHYCSIICDRWEKLTGQQAKKVGNI